MRQHNRKTLNEKSGINGINILLKAAEHIEGKILDDIISEKPSQVPSNSTEEQNTHCEVMHQNEEKAYSMHQDMEQAFSMDQHVEKASSNIHTNTLDILIKAAEYVERKTFNKIFSTRAIAT